MPLPLVVGYVPVPQTYGDGGFPLSDFPEYCGVIIGDFSYPINTSFEPYRRDAFRHRSIASQRESINIAGKTGEGTVNSQGLWRASGVDWIDGAGQLYYDRDDSVASRFLDSMGVDPFTTQYQVSLLPDQEVIRADTGTLPYSGVNSLVVVNGTLFYWRDDTQIIEYSVDEGVTWQTLQTNVYGSGVGPQMAASNGFLYWVNSSSIYYVEVGYGETGLTPVQVITTGAQNVMACADRVLCSSGPSLYDITSPGTLPASLPSPLAVLDDATWNWTCAAAGSSQIYIGGWGLGGSAVYRTTLEADGTALQAPVIALPLQSGEEVTCLFGYLNFIFAGTSLGVRMCRTVSANDPEGDTGDLIAGPFQPNLLQPYPTQATIDPGLFGYMLGPLSMAAYQRFLFVPFGQRTNLGLAQGSQWCGLLVLDLQTLTEDLAPAYTWHVGLYGDNDASTGQFVAAVATIDGPYNNSDLLYYSIPGIGIVSQASSGNLVPEGYVDTGRVTYNIADDKIACQGLIRNNSAYTYGTQYGDVAMSIDADGAGFVAVDPLSPNTESDTPILMDPLIRGEELDVRIFLSRDGTTPGNGPTVSRWTLKSWPAVVSGTTISPVIMAYEETTVGGVRRQIDPFAIYAYLEGLRLTQQPVNYQVGSYTATVVVTEIDYLPFSARDTSDYGYKGDIIVYLTSLVG